MATVVATRALSYTVKADDGSDLFASAARGEDIEVMGDQLQRLKKRGSIAEPGSAEAKAAKQPQPVGPGIAYMPLDEAAQAQLAVRASGTLSPGGPVAEAGEDALGRLDETQLRVTAGALGIETEGVSREDLIAAIHAGTGTSAVPIEQPKRRGRPPKAPPAAEPAETES
jgi:hypothetical protein